MKKKTKNPLNKNPIIIVIMVVLAIYAISLLIVLGWGLLTSFKSNWDFEVKDNYLGLPDKVLSAEELKFGNYKAVFENMSRLLFRKSYYMGDKLVIHRVDGNYFVYLINTVLYTVVGSIILSFVPAVGAYMCAKYKFKFSKIQYTVYLLFMMIPIVGAYPAELSLLRNLGLYDTFYGNWIQKFHFSGMYFFVFYAFYEGLADAYSEAAEIDGASQFRVLTSIIIPLSMKMIGSVMLIQFIMLWNDYQTPLLYLPTKPTLAYATYLFTSVNAPGLNVSLKGIVPYEVAASMLLAIPILVIYIAFNKKLLGDVSMGGIKG